MCNKTHCTVNQLSLQIAKRLVTDLEDVRHDSRVATVCNNICDIVIVNRCLYRECYYCHVIALVRSNKSCYVMLCYVMNVDAFPVTAPADIYSLQLMRASIILFYWKPVQLSERWRDVVLWSHTDQKPSDSDINDPRAAYWSYCHCRINTANSWSTIHVIGTSAYDQFHNNLNANDNENN